jgi:hypothetical protein
MVTRKQSKPEEQARLLFWLALLPGDWRENETKLLAQTLL